MKDVFEPQSLKKYFYFSEEYLPIPLSENLAKCTSQTVSTFQTIRTTQPHLSQ